MKLVFGIIFIFFLFSFLYCLLLIETTDTIINTCCNTLITCYTNITLTIAHICMSDASITANFLLIHKIFGNTQSFISYKIYKISQWYSLIRTLCFPLFSANSPPDFCYVQAACAYQNLCVRTPCYWCVCVCVCAYANACACESVYVCRVLFVSPGGPYAINTPTVIGHLKDQQFGITNSQPNDYISITLFAAVQIHKGNFCAIILRRW